MRYRTSESVNRMLTAATTPHREYSPRRPSGEILLDIAMRGAIAPDQIDTTPIPEDFDPHIQETDGTDIRFGE